MELLIVEILMNDGKIHTDMMVKEKYGNLTWRNWDDKAEDAITGKGIKVYQCICSVCGWKTGNQGMRFNFCPNCGSKMEQ